MASHVTCVDRCVEWRVDAVWRKKTVRRYASSNLESKMIRKTLTARGVQSAAIGWHGDGGGLYLQCSPGADGAINRSWVFRYRAGDRERWMGLGPIADVTLAEAREKAAAARKLRLDGI